MTLTSLPDAKFLQQQALLTIGKHYDILGTAGNGYIIKPDSGKDNLIVLQSRFEETK